MKWDIIWDHPLMSHISYPHHQRWWLNQHQIPEITIKADEGA